MSIFLPLIPPWELTYSLYACTPSAYGLPTSPVGPVRSARCPTLIDSAENATPDRTIASATAIEAIFIIFFIFAFPSLISWLIARFLPPFSRRILSSVPRLALLSFSFSVGKRVKFPVRLDHIPAVRQSVGLEDEEQDDDPAEDPLLQRDGRSRDPGEVRPEMGRHHREQLRQQDHEDRPEDRSDDAPQPPDDDHREVDDRDADAELLGGDVAQRMPVEGARHPGVERRHGEGEDPVPEDVDPHDLRRDVVVPHRHEGASRPGPHQVGREQDHRRRDDQHDVEVGAVGIEDKPADGRPRDHDAVTPAGHGLPPQKDPFEDELGGQRRDGEVETLKTQRRDAEDHSRQGGDASRRGDADPERQPHLGGDERGGVCPHAEERPLAEGDLPREPGEDIEPHRADHRDGDLHRDPEVLALDQERQRKEGDAEEPHADLDEGRLEDLDVLFVGGPEVAAILHAIISLKYSVSTTQTRSSSFVRNSPDGVIIRMRTRMTYGATSFTPARLK